VAETLSQSGATKKPRESQQEILDFGPALPTSLNSSSTFHLGRFLINYPVLRTLAVIRSTLSSNFFTSRRFISSTAVLQAYSSNFMHHAAFGFDYNVTGNYKFLSFAFMRHTFTPHTQLTRQQWGLTFLTSMSPTRSCLES